MSFACIPCYNEEKTIAKVIIQAQGYVDKVIVCDDGSSDTSAKIAERLGAIVIRHERNLGYGATLRSLFLKARELNPDTVVTLDADGQHDPNEIPKVVEPIAKGEADLVIGSRFVRERGQMPRYRKLGINIITYLTDRVAKLSVKDAQSGFRAYNRKALGILVPTDLDMGVSGELLLKASKAGLRIAEVPIEVYYEGLETSTHNPVKHGLEVIVALIKHYSIKHPLLIYGLPSVLFMIVGLLFGVWATRIYLYDRQFPMGMVLISVSATIVGAILGTTAIVLFTVISVVREKT